MAVLQDVSAMQAGVWYQKCYDPECRTYRSEAMPLPPQLAEPLPKKAAAANPEVHQSASIPSGMHPGRNNTPADAASFSRHSASCQPYSAAETCCDAMPSVETAAREVVAPVQSSARSTGSQEPASNPEAAAEAAPTSEQLAACRSGGQPSAAFSGAEQTCCWQQAQAGVFADGADDNSTRGTDRMQNTEIQTAELHVPWYLTS